MFGFTYNGRHSSEFGLYYKQTAEDKWFKDPEYDVYDANIDWRHGGYYYGSRVKVRTFTIECFFEEIDVQTRQRIKQWLKYNTSGRLIFDDKPFIYWKVFPAKVPVGNWYLDNYETHSGTVTITFNAYEPFGYLVRNSNPTWMNDGSTDYCNLINTSEMPSAPTTSSTSFDVYNPGTEECGLSIEIGGSTSNPIRFYNNRNMTSCEIKSLPSNNVSLHIDGETGFVAVLSAGSTTYENGFQYHNKGYVKLTPDRGYSDIRYVYNGLNGSTYSFDLVGAYVDQDIVGAVMTLSGVSNTKFTVTGINASNNRIYCSRTGSGSPSSSGTCSIKTVNHILIQEKVNGEWSNPSTLSLSSISVDYMPRVL